MEQAAASCSGHPQNWHLRRKAPIASERIDFGHPSIISSHAKRLRGRKGSGGLLEGVGTGVSTRKCGIFLFFHFHHQQKVLARHFRRKAPIALECIDFGFPSIIPSHKKKIAQRKGKRGFRRELELVCPIMRMRIVKLKNEKREKSYRY